MIAIRLIDSSDIEKIRSWRNSDLVNSVSYNRDYITAEMQQNWYNRSKDDTSQLHWIITYNNMSIGYAAIKNIDLKNKRCEFASLYVGENEYFMSGLGAIAEYQVIDYVFSKLDINKVFCEVLEFNKSVLQLHKKFGFVSEGILEKHYCLDGKFENVVLLALFRANWDIVKIKLNKLFNRLEK